MGVERAITAIIRGEGEGGEMGVVVMGEAGTGGAMGVGVEGMEGEEEVGMVEVEEAVMEEAVGVEVTGVEGAVMGVEAAADLPTPPTLHPLAGTHRSHCHSRW